MQQQLAQPSWRSLLNVIYAVAYKDWLSFWRYPMNALFRLIEPVVWLIPFYFMGKSFAGAAGNVGFAAYTGNDDYMAFLAIGTALNGYVSAIFWGMGFSLKKEMVMGVLETNWMTPVPRISFLIGNTVSSLLITTVSNIIILSAIYLLFGFQISGNVIAALALLVPILISLYGVGFTFAAIVLLLRDPNNLIDMTNYTVGLLSGIQFPVQVLPRFLLPFSLILPITYGFDALRGILLGSHTLIPIGYEIALMVISMLITIPLGIWVFHRVEKRCREEGSLHMH
jgi:ABC-2 type transport system permease protein